MSPLTKGYIDFCFSFSLEQLSSTPTRVTSKTATLIDHVLTNSSQKVSKCGVTQLGISDHNLVYCTRKKNSLKSDKNNDISIRLMKNYTKENFLELHDFHLSKQSLSVLYLIFKWSDWFTFSK